MINDGDNMLHMHVNGGSHLCHRKTVHFTNERGRFCYNSALADTTDGRKDQPQTRKDSLG